MSYCVSGRSDDASEQICFGPLKTSVPLSFVGKTQHISPESGFWIDSMILVSFASHSQIPSKSVHKILIYADNKTSECCCFLVIK